MKTFFGKLLKACGIAIKDEIKEVATLKPTDEDYKQGKALAVAVVSAMTAMGFTTSALGTDVIAKVFAYGIRDIKDGVEVNDKLILARVINEIKKQQTDINEAQ